MNAPLASLEKIRSKFILKNIFDYIKKPVSLSIIKYNKNIKTKLDIDEGVYRKFSQIVIKIIPIKTKSGKFINIKDNLKNFFHINIFYTENGVETNQKIEDNFLPEGHNINYIIIKIDYPIKTFENLFSRCAIIESIDFISFYSDRIENMSCMFRFCGLLQKLNLSNFNTNNVTDMSFMFSNNPLLIELNLSQFETKNVTKMNSMFSGCRNLKKIDVSSFNTINVTDMSLMFAGCFTLNILDISNFYINKVNDMHSMFFCCEKLRTFKIFHFNSKNETKEINMDKMFFGCLEQLKNKIKEENSNIKNTAF